MMNDLEKHIVDSQAALEKLEDKVELIRDRVYNGLGKEIRDEVSKTIGKINDKLWAVLASLFIALIGIIITVAVTSSNRSVENNRNFKAIVDIGSHLENHIILTEPKE